MGRSISRTVPLVGFLALLAACGGREVDLQGEGARRSGALPQKGGDAPTRYVDVGRAETLARPARTKEPVARTEVRGRGAGGGAKADGAYEVVALDPATTGTLKGVCRLSAPFEPTTIPVSKDLEACGHDSHPSERAVFDKETLGLANCVVRLVEVTKGKDWSGALKGTGDAKHLVDQKNCKYIPHVSVIRPKTQILVSNSDEALHNIHGYFNSLLTTIFNFGTAAGVKEWEAAEAFIEKPGKVILKCDVHPWMNAYVHCLPNPYYAVTDAKGAYEIAGIPAGTWKVEVWHEGMVETPVFEGTSISTYNYGPDHVETASIDVAAGGTVEKDFTIPAPAR